jgi:3D (Asp-Asp-Asp) domain-containing protein
MSKRVALIVGGLSTAAASIAALFVSKRHADAVKNAVSGAMPAAAPGTPNTITLHLTGYWPFQEGLSDKERKMEGAPVDRRGKPLHTAEDFFAGTSDHVSLSGDPDIFPYGQKINIPWGDKTLVGRVTDTGGHFHGAGKVFRVVGAEPIDVCVKSSATVIPKKTVDAQVIVGDHLDKSGKQLALDKAGKPQTASVGALELLDAEG